MKNLIGSICLTDIDKSLIKEVECKDGVKRLYLNIAVIERKAVSTYGHTHIISAAPKREERVEGKNYIIGDLKPMPERESPTQEEIDNAPAAQMDALPF